MKNPRANVMKKLHKKYGAEPEACLKAYADANYAAADLLSREAIKNLSDPNYYVANAMKRLSLAYYVFGEVRRMQGKHDESQKAYETAIEIDPDLEYVEEQVQREGAASLIEDESGKIGTDPFSLTRKGRWHVDGWTLRKYIDRGAYGHTFLATNREGKTRVLKIYELREDAIEDLVMLHGLPRDYSPAQFMDALEKAVAKEAMSAFGMNLSRDEKQYILLPEGLISKVTSADGEKVTYATVNERLEETLEDALKRGKYTTPRERISLIHEIITALSIVHKQRPNPDEPSKVERRVHNDIKPNNIGFDMNGHIRLFDFGVATTVSSKPVGNYPNLSSLEMRDPDLRAEGPKPTTRSDVWQMGCLIANILTREEPFRPDKNEEGVRKSPLDVNPNRPKKYEDGRRKFEDITRPEQIRRELPLLGEHLRILEVPPLMIDLTMRCLALRGDEKERYENAEEVLAAYNAEIEKIFSYYKIEDEFDLSKALFKLHTEFDACQFSLPVPTVSPGGDLLVIDVDKSVLEKLRNKKMFSPAGPYHLWFVDDTSGEGSRHITVNKSRDPRMLPYMEQGWVSSVGVRNIEHPVLVKDLLDFAEFYADGKSFNDIAEKISKMPEFHQETGKNKEKELERIAREEAKRDDFVVVVGYRKGKFSKDIPRIAEWLMDKHKFSRLALYVGMEGGAFANPTDMENLRYLLWGELVKDKYPVYVIAKSENHELAKAAAKHLLIKVMTEAPPEPRPEPRQKPISETLWDSTIGSAMGWWEMRKWRRMFKIRKK